jgi:hypothetical protein
MFRFTIRDVLWLTLVVAMGVGWWVERDKSAALRWQLDAVVALAQDCGCAVHSTRHSVLLSGPQSSLTVEVHRPRR